jgi:hypothetical protein
MIETQLRDAGSPLVVQGLCLGIQESSFPRQRKFYGDRSYKKLADFSRQVRQARKGPPTQGPKEIQTLNLSVFASFARDIPIVWWRCSRARQLMRAQS